jgi:hypothetical protein
MTIRANRPAERGGSQEYRRNTKAQCAGIDLGALAAGRAGLAQWPQSVLPVGGRV